MIQCIFHGSRIKFDSLYVLHWGMLGTEKDLRLQVSAQHSFVLRPYSGDQRILTFYYVDFVFREFLCSLYRDK